MFHERLGDNYTIRCMQMRVTTCRSLKRDDKQVKEEMLFFLISMFKSRGLYTSNANGTVKLLEKLIVK